MLLVADSGSTKADWTFIDDNGGRTDVNTIGLNPNLHTTPEIRNVIESVAPDTIPGRKVKQIYYYGTGIWDHSRAEKIANVLREAFGNAEIYVEHDLLGAARAACKDEAGIACILGTGSNTCLYDGVKVVDNVTNLGWLLGDEGSGVDLGKRLIRGYSYRELPEADRTHFEECTNHNRMSIGDGLYGTGNPNRFLASFSPFIHDNIDRPAIRKLVEDSFTEFFHRHVLKYDNAKSLPVSFIGSIAFHYQKILRQVCNDLDLECRNIKQKPIDALVDYHKDQLHLPA